MTDLNNVSMPETTCKICGQSFMSNTHNRLNLQLFFHGVDVHLMELRRAEKQTDETIDVIWVVDYLKGIDTDD